MLSVFVLEKLDSLEIEEEIRRKSRPPRTSYVSLATHVEHCVGILESWSWQLCQHARGFHSQDLCASVAVIA